MAPYHPHTGHVRNVGVARGCDWKEKNTQKRDFSKAGSSHGNQSNLIEIPDHSSSLRQTDSEHCTDTQNQTKRLFEERAWGKHSSVWKHQMIWLPHRPGPWVSVYSSICENEGPSLNNYVAFLLRPCSISWLGESPTTFLKTDVHWQFAQND